MKKILIVLPTYNEQGIIKDNLLRVYEFCQKNLNNYDWQILIADNGSTDRTPELAKELSEKHPQILFFHIPEKGRGYALKKAWTEYEADFYAYMDADLSSDLEKLPLLVKAAVEENYDLAIGSRLKEKEKTRRSLGREIISRAYNLMLKILFQPSFLDAQCGFKAISKKVAQEILPKVKNNNWFFDTELLVLAEKASFKIKEIPVKWVEARRKTKVKIILTIWEDIKGMIELKIRILRNNKK